MEISKLTTILKDKGFSANIWEKHGKQRIYIKGIYQGRNYDCGNIAVVNGKIYNNCYGIDLGKIKSAVTKFKKSI